MHCALQKNKHISYGIHKYSTCHKKIVHVLHIIQLSQMDNEFAKYKSGVKEKKEYGPKPTDFQAYCEINSTNQ